MRGSLMRNITSIFVALVLGQASLCAIAAPPAPVRTPDSAKTTAGAPRATDPSISPADDPIGRGYLIHGPTLTVAGGPTNLTVLERLERAEAQARSLQEANESFRTAQAKDADEIQSLKRKLDDLTNSLDESQRRTTALETELSEAREKIAGLQNASAELESARADLAKQGQELSGLRAELYEAQLACVRARQELVQLKIAEARSQMGGETK